MKKIGGALHSVVNCAGIGIPAKVVGKKSPMPLDQFNKVILKLAFYVSNYALHGCSAVPKAEAVHN